MSHISQKIFSIERGALLILLAASLLLVSSLAQAEASSDEGILVLSSRHIGMTSQEIAESKPLPEFVAAPEAEASNEWQSDHSETPKLSCPTLSAGERASLDFEGCVEASIRSGNGFGESARVCRSIFPERQAATAPVSEAPPAPSPAPEAKAEEGSAPQTAIQ